MAAYSWSRLQLLSSLAHFLRSIYASQRNLDIVFVSIVIPVVTPAVLRKFSYVASYTPVLYISKVNSCRHDIPSHSHQSYAFSFIGFVSAVVRCAVKPFIPQLFPLYFVCYIVKMLSMMLCLMSKVPTSEENAKTMLDAATFYRLIVASTRVPVSQPRFPYRSIVQCFLSCCLYFVAQRFYRFQ